jgi:hypothetical protein
MNTIQSQNIPTQNTGVQETQNPKQIQGKFQIGEKAWSVKQMDNSFSQQNTTDKKLTFLHDATHLHERQEVHEKGIFHANYGGKGFFGSIGQFFKNIKLSFEKNDTGKLAEVLKKGYNSFSDAFVSQSQGLEATAQDRMKRLEQLRKDTSKIENTLRSMIIKGSDPLPKDRLVLSFANQFDLLHGKICKEMEKITNPQNKQGLDQKNFQSI